MDYDIGRPTRHCAKTEREFRPGETFYSVLTLEGADVVRQDFSADAWEGPPEGVLGWWKAVMPVKDPRKMHWAPNDVMLNLLDELGEQGNQRDMRYVLSLLLIRRRVLRLEEEQFDEQGNEQLRVYCPKREANYVIDVVTPGPVRTEEIQNELARLLFADAA